MLRKFERDQRFGASTPVPFQHVANEEIRPVPQTPSQAQLERFTLERAAGYARRLGWDLRDYLRRPQGLACAFETINLFFGAPYYQVDPAEPLDADATRELLPDDLLVFDAQTHFIQDAVDMGKSFFRDTAPFLKDLGAYGGAAVSGGGRGYAFETYLREVFLDSPTRVVVLSGAPDPVDVHFWGKNGPTQSLSVDLAIAVRNHFNATAGSRRMLAHGRIAPNHYFELEPMYEEMQREASELHVDGWKHYTHFPINTGPFRYDDEKKAYPFFRKADELGVRVLCVHKGLVEADNPNLPYAHPGDIRRASLDFPDLSFVVFHAGMKHGYQIVEGIAGWGPEGKLEDAERHGGTEWVRDFCEDRLRTPQMRNVYAELGSVVPMLLSDPRMLGHFLGPLLRAFGSERILWGTDCIWWGSPRWVIQGFRRYRIPEEQQARFGYPALTAEDKRAILGLNAAKLYGLDDARALQETTSDNLAAFKQSYQASGVLPDNRFYGWVVP